jgi:hypothetical protein
MTVDWSGVPFALLLIVAGTLLAVLILQIPGRIARARNHPHAEAVNVLAWCSALTFGILWFIALAWAYTTPARTVATGSPAAAPPPDPAPTRRCPFCAEDIRLEAKVCRFCNREVPADSWPLIDNESAFDELIAAELKDAPQTNRRYRVHGVLPDGRKASGTVTADSPDQARQAAARHFAKVTRIDHA